MKFLSVFHSHDTMSLDMSLAFYTYDQNNLQFEVPAMPTGSTDTTIERLLEYILKHNISHVFCINGFYITQHQTLLKILHRMRIVICVWFIDNPFYFFKQLNMIKQFDNIVVFQWEKYYIPYLSDFLNQKVHYLPQATNPKRFVPMKGSLDEERTFKHELVFAANLDLLRFQELILEFAEKSHLEKAMMSAKILEGSVWQLQNRKAPSYEVASVVLGSQYEGCNELSCLFGRIIEYNLSSQFRFEFVQSLKNFPLSIWGEPFDWKAMKVKAHLLGRINYFSNMPKAYRHATLNLNLSRFQQRTGTNQRVFDVPASGALLLTDYKEELETLFDMEQELFVFKNLEDLKLSVATLLNTKREHVVSKIEKAREKVLSSHTYECRVKTVVEIVSEIHTIQFAKGAGTCVQALLPDEEKVFKKAREKVKSNEPIA